MKRNLLILWLALAFLQLTSQDRQIYIEHYSAIAMQEMRRSGIPASIKLAQGILESNAGQSMLAMKANNHFGIKCGPNWHGKEFMKKDDDRNAHGKLVKSCFRVFKSPEESYVAHTEFLMDPNKHYRYGFLFRLKSDDYKGWARGLKRSGYATNPRYPELLIKIIEQYHLYRYDEMAGTIASTTGKSSDKLRSKSRGRTDIAARRSYAVLYQNGVQFIYAQNGDSPKSLARDLDISAAKIVRYNDDIDGQHWRLHEGTRVYLQPKSTKYKGSQKFHIVGPNESLAFVAQVYGIKVKSLAKRNGLDVEAQPAPGQRLVLRGKNRNVVRTVGSAKQRQPAITKVEEMPMAEGRSEDHQDAVPRDAHERDDAAQTAAHADKNTPVQPAIDASGNEMLDPITPQNLPQVQRDPIPLSTAMQQQASSQLTSTATNEDNAAFYVVQPQDTLYKIAREHGLTVEVLKKINNLEMNTIHPGQKLKLSQ